MKLKTQQYLLYDLKRKITVILRRFKNKQIKLSIEVSGTLSIAFKPQRILGLH